MKTIDISYNPYKMETHILVDGVNVCENDSYEKFREFIDNKIPLQTWVEPIPYRDWGGFVNEISDPEINDEVTVKFSGRKIDFDDLKRSVRFQNSNRSARSHVVYHFEHVKVLDDKVLSRNIEEVVKEIRSDRFRDLIAQRTTDGLIKKYNALEQNYTIAKQVEFYIVISGVYSSGKSTLINTVIRHDVLPTSGGTCTSKNCRIKHDSSLGSRISLCCYDAQNNVVIEKRIYENDEDCAADFAEISPMKKKGAEEKYPNVHTMELGVDLSHLYPESVSEDKFSIVLIDTPGVDSAQSSEDGYNEHAELALNAISMESKPMIILCADANKYEDKSIGEFMKQILTESGESGIGFNDRYLFVMNKSDACSYKKNESAVEAKAEFAEYLTDPAKWGIKADENDLKALAESASCFVPRIFMTAARVAFAIQCKAYEYDDDDLDDSDKEDLLDKYASFCKKICKKKRENYYLSRYCDIPDYRKEEIESMFCDAMEEENEAEATFLQCGIVSVESAIRDYIERYAYPIKVRGLLETFEDILKDVSGFTSGILDELKQAKKELGEKEGERGEVGKEKKGVKKKIAELKKAEIKINEQLATLDGIKFDSNALRRAVGNFQVEIEADEEIRFIRENPKVKTGQRSNEQVLAEISGRVERIKALFDRALKKTNAELERIREKHDDQILEIYACLKTIVTGLERSGIFDQGKYRFTDSVTWKMNFDNIDPKQFVKDLRENVVKKTNRIDIVENKKKSEWWNSGNIFKVIGSLFMSDKVKESVEVDGYYKTDKILISIDEYYISIQEESDKMQKHFEGMTEGAKAKVRDMIAQLLKELKSFLNDIKSQNERLKELGQSIGALNNEIARGEETHAWLTELEKQIKGE